MSASGFRFQAGRIMPRIVVVAKTVSNDGFLRRVLTFVEHELCCFNDTRAGYFQQATAEAILALIATFQIARYALGSDALQQVNVSLLTAADPCPRAFRFVPVGRPGSPFDRVGGAKEGDGGNAGGSGNVCNRRIWADEKLRLTQQGSGLAERKCSGKAACARRSGNSYAAGHFCGFRAAGEQND